MTKEEMEKRRAYFIRCMEEGATMQSIGNAAGISRERVRQIVGPFVPRISKVRQSKLYIHFMAHPEYSVLELSKLAGYRVAQYKKLRAMGWKRTFVAHEHGSVGRYQWGCRCHICKMNMRFLQRVYTIKRAANVPERMHGTNNGYSNYRCHCEPCLEAGKLYQREGARRRKANREMVNSLPTVGDKESWTIR